MKSLVIYYSFEGNCKLMAEKIAASKNADILRIETVDSKKRTGLSKYFWGGKQVMMGERPDIKPVSVNPDDYDMIFAGTPVWAGSFAPAWRTFLSRQKIENKKVAIFCCFAGSAGKAAENLEKEMPSNTFAVGLGVRNPLNNPELDEKINEWLAEVN